MPMFTIDRSAPTVEVEEIRLLTEDEQALLLPTSTMICESLEDNDSERWRLTQAGQFIRRTGVDGERVYVTDAVFAHEYLEGFCADDVMRELAIAGAFDQIPAPAAPR